MKSSLLFLLFSVGFAGCSHSTATPAPAASAPAASAPAASAPAASRAAKNAVEEPVETGSLCPRLHSAFVPPQITLPLRSISILWGPAKAGVRRRIRFQEAPIHPAPVFAVGERPTLEYEVRSQPASDSAFPKPIEWSLLGVSGASHQNAPFKVVATKQTSSYLIDVSTLLDISSTGRYRLSLGSKEEGQSNWLMPTFLPPSLAVALRKLNGLDERAVDVIERPTCHSEPVQPAISTQIYELKQQLARMATYVKWDAVYQSYFVSSSQLTDVREWVRDDEQRCVEKSECVLVDIPKPCDCPQKVAVRKASITRINDGQIARNLHEEICPEELISCPKLDLSAECIDGWCIATH